MSHGPTDSARADRPAPLRREVILRGNDRGRAALLSGLLALAGVELGFALALMGLARHSSYVEYPAPARIQAVAAPAEVGWLGVEVRRLPRAELRSGAGGVFVSTVFDGTPAAHEGIARGDVIRRVNGVPIYSPDALVRAIRSHRPGEMVTIELTRRGASSTIATHLSGISLSKLSSLRFAR